MRRRYGFYGIAFVLFLLVFFPLFGYVTMQLWNWLIPHLLGLPAITFWQAVGLIVLTRILFGGFRRMRWGGGMRSRWVNRWEQLTPEEREKFAQAMRRKCGTWEPPAPASSTATPTA